jgi:hypothetical protein
MNRGSVIIRWRVHWQAVKSLQWRPQLAVDIRLLVLTILNGLLYWPWRWLRLALDAGDHHPDWVFGLFLLTGWMWFELWKAAVARFK